MVDRGSGGKRTKWRPNTVKGRRWLAEYAAEHSVDGRWCTWFGVGTRTAEAAKRPTSCREGHRRRECDCLLRGRGGDDDTVTFAGLWVDIDIDGPAHKVTHALAKDMAEASEVMLRFHELPSIVVDSGHGLQAWWLFNEPQKLEGEVLTGWADTWASIGREAGVHCDNVFDAARVMRIPGTVNNKLDEGATCYVIEDTGQRYDVDDLERYFREPPEAPVFTGSFTPTVAREDQGRPGDQFNAEVPAGMVLQRNGWTYSHTDRVGEHWTRPGKTVKQGTSATVYPDGGCVIWSESVRGVQRRGTKRKSYDPLGLVALLEFDNDVSAAAKRVKAEGYGTGGEQQSIDDVLRDVYGIEDVEPVLDVGFEDGDHLADVETKKRRRKKRSQKGTRTGGRTAQTAAGPHEVETECYDEAEPTGKADESSTKNRRSSVGGGGTSTAGKRTQPQQEKRRRKNKVHAESGVGKKKRSQKLVAAQEPIPLWQKRAPMPLPLEHLPHIIANACVGLGEQFQTPPDIPFVFELGLLSVMAVESKQRVEIGPKWDDALNLYLLGVSEPGTAKSPVLRALGPTVAPVRQQVSRGSRMQMQESKDELELLEAKAKAIKADIVKFELAGAATGDDGEKFEIDKRTELEKIRGQIEDHQHNYQRVLIADDITPEAFAQKLFENDSRLSFVSAEGGLLSHASRYNDNPALDALLKAWSGDDFSVTRKTNETHVEIFEPRTTAALFVQPFVAQQFYDDKNAQGTGLASRFMLSAPLSPIGHRVRLGAPAVDDEIVEGLKRLHVGIANLPATTWPMSAKARRCYLEWVDSLEPELTNGGDYAPVSSTDIMHHYVTKVTASVARLAALLALASDTPPAALGKPIQRAHVQAAIEIGKYWLDHAITMRDNSSPPVHTRLARAIIIHAFKKGLVEFKIRDMQNSRVGSYRQDGKIESYLAPDYEIALKLLKANFWVEGDNDLGWRLTPTTLSGSFLDRSNLDRRLFGDVQPLIGSDSGWEHICVSGDTTCRACRAVGIKGIFKPTTTLSDNSDERANGSRSTAQHAQHVVKGMTQGAIG